MQRVLSVESATLHVVNGPQPQIGVSAIGTVPSSGWRNPQLAAWFYIRPPEDGIQDFDFVAEEPDGITLPVVLPVSATLTIGRDRENYWGQNQPLNGVRIHSKSNSVEAEFAGDGSIDPLFVARTLSGGDAVPWPWAHRPSGGDSVFPMDFDLASGGGGTPDFSALLGKSLRVYRTGDMLTLDYRPDRANIELNPADRRIVRVWFG